MASRIRPGEAARRATARLRKLEHLWPFALVFVGYVALRVYGFVGEGVEPLRYFDTERYESIAEIAPWKLEFYLGERPLTLPLYYKLISSDAVRVGGQLAISIACWTYLAAMVAQALRDRRLRLFAFAAVLLFSASFTITLWDEMLLSESLTLSLAALVIGAWISFLRTESWPALALLVLATGLWAFVRDANAYLVLTTVPFIGIWLIGGRTRLRWAALGSMLIIFAASYVSADSPLGDSYKRWRGPVIESLSARVFPDREGLAYLERAGMPVLPGLERATESWSRGDDWFEDPDPVEAERWRAMLPKRAETFYNPFAYPQQSARYYEWLLEDGRQAYARFLLSHPGEAIAAPWRNRELLTSPPSTTAWARVANDSAQQWALGAQALPEPVDNLIYPPSFTALALALVAVLAFAAFAGVRFGASIVWWVPIVLLITAIPDALLTWHASSTRDVDRHALLVGVLPRLALVMLVLFAIDAVLQRRKEDPDR